MPAFPSTARDKLGALGLLLACALAGPSRAGPPSPRPAAVDRRPRMLAAMRAELDRSMKRLKMEGFDSPYFMAYELKAIQKDSVQARFGAVYESDSGCSRRLRVEVRVGSYDFDNVGRKKAADFELPSSGYFFSSGAPIDDDPEALRNSLWLLSDRGYKTALKAYLKLKSQAVTEVDDGEWAGSFSHEKPQVFEQAPAAYSFERQGLEALARSLSMRFERHPGIFDHQISIEGSREVRLYASSEGSRIVTERVLYNLSVTASARADDGMLLTQSLALYSPERAELAQVDALERKVDRLIAELEALRAAPVLDPYTGPAILDGEATGVLFHEVIGHRLEGERQLDDEEGKTFKGRLGQKIIPDFLSIVDDPTLEAIGGTRLNGHYRFDDEGVPARRVVLVERGVLKSFLLSRTPVKGFRGSNGHGRSAPGEKPRARMANTVVLSERRVPFDRLKRMLIEEVARQKKPYGLIIKNIVGGSTQTSSWGYQAYKGVPQQVYRIFPDGREELVRGVEIVGTPLSSINKIAATSDRTAVFNGYCGAESGYVPVSASAPDVLMTEIELQRTRKESEKPPILPSPWSAPTH
ncbi:MAG: TldD/PmbA family protein [Deltaproteobacteria bacterium]|nr:TldD/PmbA family protein [Deltaproteobacteria bacterium]